VAEGESAHHHAAINMALLAEGEATRPRTINMALLAEGESAHHLAALNMALLAEGEATPSENYKQSPPGELVPP